MVFPDPGVSASRSTSRSDLLSSSGALKVDFELREAQNVSGSSLKARLSRVWDLIGLLAPYGRITFLASARAWA
jgi:DUF1365 family protein